MPRLRGRFGHFSPMKIHGFHNGAMTWIQRLAAFLLLAGALGSAALAQDDTTAPAPEPSVAALRAQLDKIPTTVQSNADVRSLLARINDIGSEGEKFVASRSGQLADLNARLGELGDAPAAGATEDPDVTRQRATLT